MVPFEVSWKVRFFFNQMPQPDFSPSSSATLEGLPTQEVAKCFSHLRLMRIKHQTWVLVIFSIYFYHLIGATLFLFLQKPCSSKSHNNKLVQEMRQTSSHVIVALTLSGKHQAKSSCKKNNQTCHQ